MPKPIDIIVLLFLLTLLVSCRYSNKYQKELKGDSIINNPSSKGHINNFYLEAMDFYDGKNYDNASDKINLYFKKSSQGNISSGRLYNGACIYALNHENKKAFDLLDYLATDRFYSNFDHIKSDSDLLGLHSEQKWEIVLDQVRQNKETEPERKQEHVKNELFKARAILNSDDGKLWGENLWSDNILVIDYDKTIFSLKNLSGTTTHDSILFYKKFKDNELSFTNTTQDYKGEKYATVMIHSIDDESATIIHELFHLSHLKNNKLRANPVAYLEKYEARKLLRLEFAALKNALWHIETKGNDNEINTFINDAFIFRKIRQHMFTEYLDEELELETVEGLANYTGYKLSSHKNLYREVYDEINFRESAKTYSRPFPYATGVAYGILFDYLGIAWRTNVHTIRVYNFLDTYENNYLNKAVNIDETNVNSAKKRNNYNVIDEEENSRKVEHEKNIAYYTDLLLTQPTLKVTLADKQYSMSFNMNGTLILEDIGIVYSGITGKDMSGKNFGNFTINAGKDKLGVGGVLKLKGTPTTYVFPLPVDIKRDKIVGDFYKIELNEGWEVVKINTKGDVEIKISTKIE